MLSKEIKTGVFLLFSFWLVFGFKVGFAVALIYMFGVILKIF